MGQLPGQRRTRALTTVTAVLGLMLVLPGGAVAGRPNCPEMPATGGGQTCVAETATAESLDPACATGTNTTYYWWLQVNNNALVQSGQVVDGNGTPYSSMNPLCGPGSTFSGFTLTDNPPSSTPTYPGTPPDGPQFHWADLSVNVSNVPQAANNTTPLVKPQIFLNSPFCAAVQATKTPTLSSEGITDLVGDLLIQCTGGQPVPSGEQVPTTNLTLKLNTPVTSRLLGAGSFNQAYSESLALVRDPFPNHQKPCIPSMSAPSCPVTGGDTSPPNVFQGKVSNNAVSFIGMPINPPQTQASGSFFRIVNVRTNPSGLGANKNIQGTVLFSSPLFGTTEGPIILGHTGRGPLVTLFNPAGGTFVPPTEAQCHTARWGDYSKPAGVQFAEGFPFAFTPRAISTTPSNAGALPASQATPGQIDYSETGFFNYAFPNVSGQGDLGRAGLANFGDRLFLDFTHVPKHVEPLVPQELKGSNGGEALRVSDPFGPFSRFTPASGLLPGLGQVPLSGGSGTAAFEIVAPDNSSASKFKVPIFIKTSGTPGLGTADVSAGLGPLSTVNGASATAPVPRFHSFELPSHKLFSVAACPP